MAGLDWSCSSVFYTMSRSGRVLSGDGLFHDSHPWTWLRPVVRSGISLLHSEAMLSDLHVTLDGSEPLAVSLLEVQRRRTMLQANPHHKVSITDLPPRRVQGVPERRAVRDRVR